MTLINRRAALGGIALFPATAGESLANVPVGNIRHRTQQPPALQLAADLSAALADEGGEWRLSVGPLLDGQPDVRAERVHRETVEVLTKCAFLFGCLPPAERQIALVEMEEMRRQRRQLA
jgi:hypothetical protein